MARKLPPAPKTLPASIPCKKDGNDTGSSDFWRTLLFFVIVIPVIVVWLNCNPGVVQDIGAAWNNIVKKEPSSAEKLKSYVAKPSPAISGVWETWLDAGFVSVKNTWEFQSDGIASFGAFSKAGDDIIADKYSIGNYTISGNVISVDMKSKDGTRWTASLLMEPNGDLIMRSENGEPGSRMQRIR